MATGAALAKAKARRTIASHFLSRDAVTPDRAVPCTPARWMQRSALAQLQRAGVVRAGAAGGLYLDVPAWEAYAQRRRRMGVAILALVILLGGALMAFTQ